MEYQNIKPITIIRWLARITAAFFFIFILAFAIEQKVDPFSMGSHELTLTISFSVMWLGFIIAIFREGVGGLLIIAGILSFYLFSFIFSGFLPQGLPLFVLISPGVLFTIVWLHDKYGNNRSLAKI
ncbi:MAG TPA: hypothetical protein VKA34_05005 [Balneolales bacterium]|nr:hypothetical protein [Balneolales bacterium]